MTRGSKARGIAYRQLKEVVGGEEVVTFTGHDESPPEVLCQHCYEVPQMIVTLEPEEDQTECQRCGRTF